MLRLYNEGSLIGSSYEQFACLICAVQFYDHVFDWNLKREITALAAVRRRNGIKAGSKLRILAAESDLYVAMVDERVVAKIGPRFDVGGVIPQGFKVAAHGDGYCVWEKSRR